MGKRAGVGLSLALALLAGCGSDSRPAHEASYDPLRDTSVYNDAKSGEMFDEYRWDHYASQAWLPDGRRLYLWYSQDGSKLMEQHYSPTEGAWTEPRALYTSEEQDPCQGITIVEEHGIVALNADFGLYCYDGEPPMDSVALVSTGDLTKWATHSTKGFDGWETVRISPEGTVEWRAGSQALSWTEAKGFSSPSE